MLLCGERRPLYTKKTRGEAGGFDVQKPRSMNTAPTKGDISKVSRYPSFAYVAHTHNPRETHFVENQFYM